MSTHHNISLESLAAYDRSLPTHESDREKILAWIKGYPRGLTSKDLAERMSKPLHAISGRLTKLRDDGLIEKCGVRDDCGTWVMKKRQQELF